MGSTNSPNKNEMRFFPLGIKLESILGLLKTINNVFNRHTDIFVLADYFDLEADDLLPLLSALEILGFALIQGGDVMISKHGEDFLKAPSNTKKQIIRERIKNLEPFKTTISMLNQVKEIKIEDLVKELEKLGYSEINELGFNEKLTQTLIDWGVFSGILSYSSKDQTFKLNKRHFK